MVSDYFYDSVRKDWELKTLASEVGGGVGRIAGDRCTFLCAWGSLVLGSIYGDFLSSYQPGASTQALTQMARGSWSLGLEEKREKDVAPSSSARGCL